MLGSRTKPRSEASSAVAIDILGGEEFHTQPSVDVLDKLRTLVPSFNVSTIPIDDAATLVRPANLRGLPPDNTLVLVNGKRRHRAAVITFLGHGLSDGAQGPDISVFPSMALEQVEVLRDGAAAQYGSDAIAGVINFILNDASSGSIDPRPISAEVAAAASARRRASSLSPGPSRSRSCIASRLSRR